MKISLNWLKDYIDIPSTPDELGEILTSLGLEVEGMEEMLSVKGGLAGLVVGEVRSCDKHPNADRLSITSVDIGADELLHIVCGAPNVASGQKVVVATVGTTLYPIEGESFKIKSGKIRGEVSEGMICAEDEIGIGRGHEGIIVLPESAMVGSSVAQFYNVEKDVVYEIGLTPNRSDATSHIGVAKDLLAYYRYHHDQNLKLNQPEPSLEIDLKEDKKINVEIRDLDRCPRFSGVTLSNINIGPSPDWMQKRLNAVGVRPISNVVDITNYVLHEYGQPLHAYDFSKIEDRTIHVQTLSEGTKFVSLDDKERILSGEDLIVCDGNDKGMCIAGIFGGVDSGVTGSTSDIFLEAAYFDAHSIRKSSTRHALRSDAAKCFEKGTDPSNTVVALKRAADLMSKYAGAVVSSEIVDEYQNIIQPKEIVVRKARVSQLIGCEISDVEIERILKSLEIKILSQNDHSFSVAIPTNKADVTREIDVIEEILRIYGFNNVPVPSRLSTSISATERIDPIKLRKIVSELLVNKGYREIQGLSLIPSAMYEGFDDHNKNLVRVNNTSNIHLDAMRPEMLFSMILAAQYNINRQQQDLAFFEIGRSYLKAEDMHDETEWITMMKTGEAYANTWRHEIREIDFYDIKESVLAILDRLGLTSYQVSESEDARFTYGLKFHRGPKTLLSCGAVSESVKKTVGVDQQIFYAEMHVQNVLQAIKKVNVTITEIHKYPSSRRDLALTIDDHVLYENVYHLIKKNGSSLLKSIDLFDIYRDKKSLGPGKKSYAISMIFEDAEKNLQDKVLDKIMNKVISQLDSELGAKLR